MEKRKLKVIICGTTFGQFYMDAISRLKDIFEFAGIFAGGSKRSVMCAESYGVPLYTKFEDIPSDIDIACVVIRSGALGGKGTEIALKFMERGVNVIQEQPVHYKDIAVCIKSAMKNKVFFKTGDLYIYLPEIKRLIDAVKEIEKQQKILYASFSCCPQVSYPMIDILEKLLPSIKPFHVQNVLNTEGPFQTASAVVGKIPVIINYDNEIDPDDPDNFMHLLHSIVIGFECGHLTLVDTFGPLVWTARLHSLGEGYSKEISERIYPEYMKDKISTVLGDYSDHTYEDMVRESFPCAVARDLVNMYDYIANEENISKVCQREIDVSTVWHKMTQAFGFAKLKRGCVHQPIPSKIVVNAALKQKYDDFFIK